MPTQLLDIAGRKVGPGQPCFVIAEAGVNHNGDMKLARRLVEVAAQAGADAIKFQTFRADQLVTAHAAKAAYQIKQMGTGESQHEMLRRLELSHDQHRELMELAHERNLLFMSTPFEENSADLLYEMGVAVFKIPSGELNNLPFLSHVAKKGRPLIISTGMASLGEVEAAVQTCLEAGNDQFVLLQCVSNYPANPADCNLHAMQTLAGAFGVATGYSDHTLGIEVPLAAVALGACVIEKHFTLDRGLPGPDHQASSEPDELATLVHGIRKVESSLGDGRKMPALSESSTATVARKSLVAAEDIPAGNVLSMANVAIKRPGTGLPPVMRPWVIGRKARTPIPAGTVLTLEMVA